MTDDFLRFTRAQGNDLTTASPLNGFPGLKPGDRWCLCASCWQQALKAGVAPPVDLMVTNEKVLQTVSLEELLAHAADPSPD